MEEIKKIINVNVKLLVVLCLIALLVGTLIGVYIMHDGFIW